MNFKFKYKPVIDYGTFIINYVCREEIDENLGIVDIKCGLDKYLDLFDSKLSSFIKKEIEFFKPLEGITVATLGFIDDFEELYSVQDYLDEFNKSTDEELFNYLGGAFISEFSKGDNDGWEKVKYSMELMKSYISNLEGIDESHKKNILDLYDSPNETRMRLKYIIEKFIDIYSEFEDELREKSNKEKIRYEELLNENVEKFMKVNHLDKIKSIIGEEDDVDIYVSYCNKVGVRFNKVENRVMAIIGYKNIEFEELKSLEKNLEKFLKLISDKTRQKIISLIADKPWYNQAMAKELDITPATVNYHIQSFLVIDLVSIDEKDNKIYYSLNKDMANKYIDILKGKLKLI